MGKGLPVIDFGSPLFYICILFRITVKFAIESFRESLLNNAVFLRVEEQLLVLVHGFRCKGGAFSHDSDAACKAL